MAMPKKGSSKITVDGTVYRWRVGRHRSGSLLAGDRVLIEAVDASGATLAVVLDVFWCDNPIVRPGRVAEWIRQARKAGWQAELPGRTFSLELGPVPPRLQENDVLRILGRVE